MRLAISLPMVVLALGLGNVQGPDPRRPGFMRRSPATVAVGLTSIVNEPFGAMRRRRTARA
jgi:hypothetical protein